MSTRPNYAQSLFYERCGARLREIRQARGLSMRQLARLVDMSESTIANAEEGHSLSLYLATLIAEAIDECSLEDLVPLDATGPAKKSA